MRVSIMFLTLLAGCTPTLHVLTSEGRPMRVYDHNLSCQFAAFHEHEKGTQLVECTEMTSSQLLQFENGRELYER
jgi:hypothetical protein